MKTNIFSPKKAHKYLYIGLLSLFMVSCGSYQNSSYYESDGIYGATSNRNIERQNTSPNNYYGEYFKSLQNDSQSDEIFTDIDNYSDYSYVDNPNSNSNYADWGNNYTKTDINFYSNNLGLNYGYGYSGWGNPYYGYGWNNPYNNFGWGNPYGFGWNSWGLNYGFGYSGWGNPYYGYNNYYYNRPYNNSRPAYAPSRRGAAGVNSSYSGRNYTPARNYSTDRNYNSRNYSTDRTTNTRTYNNPNNSQPTTTRRNATQNTNRQYDNSSSRNESYTPTRSYNTSSNSGQSSGRSYGGGGGGGSTRSSGGGGRR